MAPKHYTPGVTLFQARDASEETVDAMRIGMKHPDVFAALYAMSSCCLFIDPAPAGDAPAAPPPAFANALAGQAAAWAPNPANPPQYFDVPFKDGELQPLVHAKWLANAPLVMVDQYVPSCGARRMTESAALLADEVLPKKPLRQWVLSLPFALRFLLADTMTVTRHWC